MTTPSTGNSQGEPARFAAGAVDLEQLKSRAQAQSQPQAASSDSTIPAYFEVSDQNFEVEVVRRSTQVPVVVLVGTSRSPESDEMKATFQRLAVNQLGKFLFGYVDADAQPAIAQAFRVEALPTVIALGQGQPLTQFQGVQPAETIEQWVGALVEQVGAQLSGLEVQAVDPSGDNNAADDESQQEADPRQVEAEQSIATGDYDRAIELYDELIRERGEDKQLQIARNTVSVFARHRPQERDTDAIAEAEAHPDDVDKQLDAADAEIIAGAPEKAFDRLIGKITTTAGDDKDRLRARVLELFELFDASDPRVIQARTKLASALF